MGVEVGVWLEVSFLCGGPLGTVLEKGHLRVGSWIAGEII